MEEVSNHNLITEIAISLALTERPACYGKKICLQLTVNQNELLAAASVNCAFKKESSAVVMDQHS
jgi:hypothetical protein